MDSKLKSRRIASGYTQSQLSEASGVNIKSIALYEQNPDRLSKASVMSVIRIADCLGCSVEDIIDRSLMG